MVMCHGDIIEHGPSDDVILNPQQDYTKCCLMPRLIRRSISRRFVTSVAVSNAAWNTSDHHLIACNSLGLWPRFHIKEYFMQIANPVLPGFNADPR